MKTGKRSEGKRRKETRCLREHVGERSQGRADLCCAHALLAAHGVRGSADELCRKNVRFLEGIFLLTPVNVVVRAGSMFALLLCSRLVAYDEKGLWSDMMNPCEFN